jgi:hypothetical protein
MVVSQNETKVQYHYTSTYSLACKTKGAGVELFWRAALAGNCSVVALHSRQPRLFDTAVRFASGVLREQCSLVTILFSQRACMRVVIRGLAAVLLEFPAHPASIPDADSIPEVSLSKQKAHPQGVSFLFCWWDGGTRTAAMLLALGQ